jgi:hypothetical protein
MIIGIIISLAFLFLLAKAILETIWGIGLILCGIFWHIVGRVLDVLIFISKIVQKFRKTQARPQPFVKTALSHSV